MQKLPGKVENGFKYIEFSHEEVILEKEISWNYLLFVLEGECVINCNQFRERLFQANCMVLLPKTAMVEIKVIAGTRLLSLSFDVPLNVCDKFILQSLTGLCRKLDYNFQSLAIRYPLPPYLEIVTYCLTNKMDCGHFHTLLQQELFFYSGVLSERRISLIVPPDHLSRINFQRFCHWQLF